MQDDPSSPSPRRRSWTKHTSKATCGLIKPPPRSQTSTTPQRKRSLRERFFTVNAANTHIERDRELKRLGGNRGGYVPTHAAESFERTASPRRQQTVSSEYGTGPGGQVGDQSDYAAFVRRSEARDVAGELYGEDAAEERAPRRRFSNKVARRIVEYVKPTREER